MAVGEPASAAANDAYARLRNVARSRENVDVAQLQFVGLDRVRQAYGDRWPSHQARIQDAAETYLRKRLGDADVLIRGEGGFLLVMGSAAGPEAHAAAAQLTHGLNAFFTGDSRETPAPRFDSVVQTVATRDLATTLARGPGLDEPEIDIASVHTDAAELDWKFEPVWDVRREALSYWYAAPLLAATGARVPGYQFEAAPRRASHLLKIDEGALWIAEQTLIDLALSGRQALVGATVHVQSLANLASRARIFATLNRLTPELNRFRLIKIAGIPHGYPRMYVREMVGALRSRVPNIALLVSWDEPDLGTLLHPGLMSIGIVTPASGFVTAPVVHIPALMARVTEGVRQAHAARTRFFVEGSVTKYLALKFARAGVDNIASSAIWPMRTSAHGIERWPVDGLAA